MSLERAIKKLNSYELGITHTLVTRYTNNFRNRILRPYDLNSAEWFVLGLVYSKTSKGGIRVTDLAAILDVKTTYITAILGTLRIKQYVDTNSDSSDARVRLIVATNKGETAAKQIETTLRKETEKLLRNQVSGEEYASYLKVMRKIAQLPQS
ncbi:MAG TPA: hypothetical protein VF733_06895 [Candidatus Saccharimonadales bacterium]